MSNTLYVDNLQALGGSGTINVKAGTAIRGEGGGIINCPGLLNNVKCKPMAPVRLGIRKDALTIIPGTELDFRCYRGDSKVLLRAVISTNAPYVTSFGFLVDGVAMWDATGNNNANGAVMTQYVGQSAPNTNGYLWYGGTTATAQNTSRTNNSNYQENMYTMMMQYVYTPGDGSLKTYSIGATCSWAGQGGYMLLINDRWSFDMRSISTISAMEISA